MDYEQAYLWLNGDRTEHSGCRAAAEAMEAEVVRLRAALRPFAALAEHFPPAKQFGNRPTEGVLVEMRSKDKVASYSVEDLRAAEAAMQATYLPRRVEADRVDKS